jgi:hypothetical protein
MATDLGHGSCPTAIAGRQGAMHEMMLEDRTIYLNNFGHLKVIVDDNRDILA